MIVLQKFLDDGLDGLGLRGRRVSLDYFALLVHEEFLNASVLVCDMTHGSHPSNLEIPFDSCEAKNTSLLALEVFVYFVGVITVNLAFLHELQ